MSVYFNGRLYTTPTTASVVNDDAMANTNLSVGNVVALIGQSDGGTPKTALRFGSFDEAAAVLVSGELLDVVKKAFDPSAQTGGPSLVVAMRVNPAVQASGAIQDGSAVTVINLSSTDYGLRTNGIKYKIESGTTLGKKLTTQLGNSNFTQDNVYRNPFSIQYTGGAGSAQMSITGTSVTLQAPTGTTVATIDLNTYPTAQQLVDRINAVAGFSAAVVDGNGAVTVLNGMDYVSGQDVKTSLYTASANLQACVDWYNGLAEGFVTATRVPGVGTVPANIPFAYLSGGSNGSVTNNDWSDCFTALQAEDVQLIAPVSSSASIWAMADSHAAYMSTVGRMERRAICGMALGSSDSAALAAAKALNSDRTSLCHIGYYDYDANGNLTLYPPYYMAGLIAGMFAGVNAGTALTNKTIKVRGLERKLRNPTDTDPLIQGGVLCVEDTKTGFKVVKSISTWLTNKNYNRVEVSCGIAVDFSIRNVRDAVDILRGEKSNPTLLSRSNQITETVLKQLARPEPEGPGVLAGDKDNPAFKNITSAIEGDVLRIQFQASPVVPNNYILVTMYAVPFSGSASV